MASPSRTCMRTLARQASKPPISLTKSHRNAPEVKQTGPCMLMNPHAFAFVVLGRVGGAYAQLWLLNDTQNVKTRVLSFLPYTILATEFPLHTSGAAPGPGPGKIPSRFAEQAPVGFRRGNSSKVGFEQSHRKRALTFQQQISPRSGTAPGMYVP